MLLTLELVLKSNVTKHELTLHGVPNMLHTYMRTTCCIHQGALQDARAWPGLRPPIKLDAGGAHLMPVGSLTTVIFGLSHGLVQMVLQMEGQMCPKGGR